MALGFQAAGRIDRQPAVLLGPALGDGARALAFRRQTHRFVFDELGDREAVMRLGEGEVAERDAGARKRAFPGFGAAVEFEHVAPRHRQEILHMLGRAEHHRLAHAERGLHVRQHQRSRAVGDERAIGALERAGHERILVAFGAAEIESEILAQLRVRIGDAVLVILGRDAGQRVGLVAVFLEIKPGDLAEDAGEAAGDIGLLAHIGGLEQVLPDLGARGRRHLLDPDHQHDAGGLGLDRPKPLMDGRRAGRAGILDPGCAPEAQIGRGLQHQRGGKILRREAGVEVTEHDLVHIGRGDTRVGERVIGHAHDQAFDRFGIEPAEHRMGPSDHTGGHERLLRRILDAFLGNQASA